MKKDQLKLYYGEFILYDSFKLWSATPCQGCAFEHDQTQVSDG